ncbi:TonB-dependent receptor [Undibacterium flavidum]|uniref:TonB-dependent receptor n=1 Tax=Undibacterium flavidum TaxID=2762297 RepID=A0ABR6YA43_9BURK|nr:TonB-dependent receptor [Undibacterium flavidum]MBC3873426.1 TonB-dependent receptor [Undibacterium flavidum]
MKHVVTASRLQKIPVAIRFAWSLLLVCTNHGFAQSSNAKKDVEKNAVQKVLQESNNATSPSTATTAPDNLPAVVIQGQKSRSALALRGTSLQSLLPGMNPLKGMHQLSGVNFQSADPWGNNEQNFSLTIHGFSAQQLGYTLDGVPLGDQQYGNYNGLSPQRAIISENVRNVVLNSGAGDLATASTSNLGGTIESFSTDPRPQSGLSFAQTVGSDASSRSFIRYDSGELAANTLDTDARLSTGSQAYYLSFVRHRAKAWDFEGEQGGEQFNAKWVKHFALAKLTAYYNFSDKAEPNEDSVVHNAGVVALPYTRPTTYPDFDYAKRYLTANGEPPRHDGPNYRNYFGVAQRRDHLAYLKLDSQIDSNNAWNNQIYAHYDNGLGAVAGPIGVAGLPNLFKVYFPEQDLKQTFGDSGYAVRTTEYQIHRSGLISQWQANSGAHQWQTGIWLERNHSSAYRRWYGLDANDPLSPYQRPAHPLITQYGSEIENQVVQWHWQDEWKIYPNLSLQTGLKSSLQFADGRFPVQPKLGAINGGSSALPEGKIITKKWMLPQFGLLWRTAEQDQFYVNLQKNLRQFITYGAVGASPWSLNNQTAFDLFKRTAEPETAISIEGGVRGRREFSNALTRSTGLTGMEAQLSLYHVNFRDRLLQISPTPVISSIVNGNPILANVGSVKTQGIDISMNLQWGAQYSLFNGLSYNRSTYQDDYLNGNNRVNTSGKQVPVSPNWLNKTMFKANWNALEWQLMADYVGRRYATYTNDMAIPSHLLVNFSLQYRLPWAWNRGQNRLNFQILNLTQRRGVSTLVVGAANGTYNSFPIAPRQLFVGLSSGF